MSGKIIIKPRAQAGPSTPATPADDYAMDEADEGEEGEELEEFGAEEYDEPAPVPMKRPRGRPRGRGRGALVGSPRAFPAPSLNSPGRPRGRGRGRGGRGRGRAVTVKLAGGSGDEGSVEHEVFVEQAPPFVTVQGRTYAIEGDELICDDDPAGAAKVDADGNLLGGRRFKAGTFSLPTRHPTKRFMLAIDAARTSGFRDSLYYFRRNPLAHKLNATQWEKEFLIAQGSLGTHLRTRSVTLVAARTVFKLHGSKTVLGGRYVLDDYYEERARALAAERGAQPGDLVLEPADPATNASAADMAAIAAAGKGERGGGAYGAYRPGGPTTLFGGPGWGPYSDGPLNAVRKSMLARDGVDEENWMAVAAQRTADASAQWARQRAERMRAVGEEAGAPRGVYEPHSHLFFSRDDVQPTRARWEPVPDSADRQVLGGTKAGNGAWGLAWVDTVMELPPPKDDAVITVKPPEVTPGASEAGTPGVH